MAPWDSPGGLNDPNVTIRCDHETDQKWHSIVIQEPVSSELKEMVRADLWRAWHFDRYETFRQGRRREWTTVDGQKTILEGRIHTLTKHEFHFLCNRPTALYWLNSAQIVGGYSTERAYENGECYVSSAILEEWFQCYDTDPNIEFGHSFANPVKLTTTGPSTIEGILYAHRSLCEQATRFGERAGRTDMDRNNYSLHPLYHAIVVILDRVENIDCCRQQPDDKTNLYKFARHQTVLLAKTGKESGLKAPISFESLKSFALPLERIDVLSEDNVIRVSIATAVKFIVDLEKQEDIGSQRMKSKIHWDKRLALSSRGIVIGRPREEIYVPETWRDGVMESAEEFGLETSYATRTSIRRILAQMVGEGYCEFDPQPFS